MEIDLIFISNINMYKSCKENEYKWLSILIQKTYIRTRLITNKINLRISNLTSNWNCTIYNPSFRDLSWRTLRLYVKNYFVIISFEIKRDTVDRKIQFLWCFLSFFYPRIAITRDKMQHQWSGKRKAMSRHSKRSIFIYVSIRWNICL